MRADQQQPPGFRVILVREQEAPTDTLELVDKHPGKIPLLGLSQFRIVDYRGYGLVYIRFLL
jgi:hypothetical protein